MSTSIEAIVDSTDLSWQWDFYRGLHGYPELSGQEEWTAAQIVAQLAAYDATVIDHIGGHGIVAIFTNGDPKDSDATVLLRADIDALPVVETTGADYASKNGNMHACGHDMHATALLGLCAILDANRDKWRGTVIALFQPAEENGSGALAMLDDGLVGRIPRPDVFLAQHIIPGPAGTVFSKEGPTLAGSDSIEIIVHGRSAHGSMPHTAIDPTYVAAMIVVRLQGIVGREIPPSEFAVASVGTLDAGHSNNIIPGEARIVVNCRTYDESVRERLNAAIERVVRAECAASGVTAEPTIRYFAHAPITNNSAEVFAKVRPEFDSVFGANSQDAREWTASEDFTNIPRAYGDAGFFPVLVCGVHAGGSVGGRGCGRHAGAHNPSESFGRVSAGLLPHRAGLHHGGRECGVCVCGDGGLMTVPDRSRDIPVQRHTIFQSSLMTALLDGIYDGELTIGELLGHGNFGIGTFDALDGEMIIVDGVCYQVRGDGSATVADLEQHSPFAVATNFVPRIVREAPPGMCRKELSEFISGILPSENYMYAVRITGMFESVRVRTVTKQQRPYRPMLEATGDDAELVFSHTAGIIAGFRTPIYEKGIGIPGCHVHFIDNARTHGGHVLDFTLSSGLIEVCPGTDLQLRLPLNHEFSTARLAPEDLDQQIHATEVKE